MRKILASDVAATLLGTSLDFSDNQLFCGAPGANSNQGAVYVYDYDPNTGNFTNEQKLTASDGAAGHQFGCSLSVCGDWLVIGAKENPGTIGSAYAFHKVSGVWTQVSRLVYSAPAGYHYFGHTVVCGPNYMAVCSVQFRFFCIYRQSLSMGATETEQQAIIPTGWAYGLGNDAACSGDTLVLGAREDRDSAGGSNIGAVYIYTDDGTAFTLSQKLRASDIAPANDYFGYSVAIENDLLMVGSPRCDHSGFTDPGAIYVYTRSGGIFANEQKRYSATIADYTRIGRKISIRGGQMLTSNVPAWQYMTSSTSFVELWDNSSGDWSPVRQFQTFQPLGAYRNDFGTSLCLGLDNLVLVGESLVELASGTTGMIYAWIKDATNDWQHIWHHPDDLGRCLSVTISDDGNDILYGAHLDPTMGSNAGSATFLTRVVTSGVTSWTSQKVYASDAAVNMEFGVKVVLSGDWAFISGERRTVSGISEAGSLYIFKKTAGVWNEVQILTAPVVKIREYFSSGVTVIGSYLCVGASGHGFLDTVHGSVYIFTLVGGVWTHLQTLTDSTPVGHTFFGKNLATNGTDLFVATPRYAVSGHAAAGRVNVFEEVTPGVWAETQIVDLASYARGSRNLGTVMQGRGNRWVIGDPEADDLGIRTGCFFVLEKVAGTWTMTHRILAPVSGTNLGASVALRNDELFIGAKRLPLFLTGSDPSGNGVHYTLQGGNWVRDTTVRTYMPTPDLEYQIGDFTCTSIGEMCSTCAFAIDSGTFVMGPGAMYYPSYAGNISGGVYIYDPLTLLTPPYLISGPLTPNNDLTTVPSEWSIGCTSGIGDITSLVVGGYTAVLANVVQPGFTGTVVANGLGGYDVSLVADIDYWMPYTSIDWIITMNNGALIVTATGTIYKDVTLPYPAAFDRSNLTANKTWMTNIDSPLRFEEDCSVVLTTDEHAIQNNLENSIMVLKRGIPLQQHLGSSIPLLVFDPNDDRTLQEAVHEVLRAASVGEPRAELEKLITAAENDKTLTFAVPFRVNVLRNSQPKMLTIGKVKKDKI
jgi:phage baseplate assembly protein W